MTVTTWRAELLVFLTGTEDAGDLKMLTEKEARARFNEYLDETLEPWFFGQQVFAGSKVLKGVDPALYEQEWDRFRYEMFSTYELPVDLASRALKNSSQWHTKDGALFVRTGAPHDLVSGNFFETV